jgi:uncharacterized membrane protein
MLQLALLAVGIVALLILGGFMAAVLALSRVRQLEQRLSRIEAALAQRSSPPAPLLERLDEPHPAEAGVRPPPAVPIAAVPEVSPTPPPQPAVAALPSHARAAALAVTQKPILPPNSGDWEAAIAGRWLNRLGLLAVTVGVSYFLKYAIDNDWVGPRGQVAAGLLLGAAIVAFSTRFVRRGLGYFADGLTGLGAAVMYLSLWAGTSYYGFLRIEVGFAAMACVTAAMLVIALGRNSRTVAVLAMLGGFLTPWLVSTGENAEVTLFTYLAIHNAALIALARTRSWRLLELPAFVFTQIYFWVWANQFYADPALVRTIAFSALFFAEFSILPVVRVRQSGRSPLEQSLLVLANASLFVFALTVMLWAEHRWTLTLAVLILSAVHLGLARAVPARTPSEAPVRLVFGGLALALATAAIPIRLEGAWITIGLAIEAAILAWTGFAARLRFPRVVAYVLFALVADYLLGSRLQATTFLFNARLATAIVVAACACVPAWLAARPGQDLFHIEPVLVGTLAVAANILLLWAMTMEVDLYFDVLPGRIPIPMDTLLSRSLAISLLWITYATVLLSLGVRVESARLRWQGLALFGVTALKLFLVDLSFLSGFYRIASSVVLGLVLLAVSFLYQRALPRRTSQETS